MSLESATDTLAQLTYRFFYCLDERRFADLLAMMKPDAVWHRQGKHLRGHDEILAELKSRSPTQRIRHVITNSFIDTADDRSATVKAYMVAYRFDDGTAPQPPVALDGPLRMVLLTTHFVREGDGKWLIAEQSAVPEFEFRAACRGST
jgi:hypothetical protein